MPVPIPVLRFRLLVGAVACQLLASLIGLAVMNDEKGRAGEALAEVRSFLKDNRTATFTSTSAWTGDTVGAGGEMLRKTGRGEVRLPNEAHAVVNRADGGAEEVVVHVDRRFRRDADRAADLGKNRWEPLPTDAEQRDNGWSQEQRFVVDILDYGVPTNLDGLLANLPRAELAGPGSVRGSYSLGELFPRSRSAGGGGGGGGDSGGGDPGGGDLGGGSALKGRLVVTVGFGAGGRLDSLRLETRTDAGHAEFVRTDAFQFSNWGAPVAFTLPDRTEVRGVPGEGAPPGADVSEEARAAVKERVAIYEPARLPEGWGQSGQSWASDDARTCGYFALEYGPAADDPRLALASSSRECPTTPINTDDVVAARPIQIGEYPGAVIKQNGSFAFTDVRGAAIMLEVGATRIVAVSSEGEQFLIDTLHRLRLVDPNAI